MRGLARMAQVLPRTVRQWIVDGLVDRPPAHGYNTHYGPKSVLQVRVIMHYRAQGKRLREIARRIKGASEEDLAALLPTPSLTRASPADTSAGPAPAAKGLRGLAGEAWMVVPLIAGMQLMVRTDASEFVQTTAVEIARRFRVA